MVWVLDTSALINFKKLIPEPSQWQAFKELEGLVEAARLTFVRQVRTETSGSDHPDVPGVWVDGVHPKHPLEPEYEYVRRVMALAGDVVDKRKDSEDADPYVLFMALQLGEQGWSVVIVTDDVVDHMPIKIALGTACERMGVSHIDSRAFLVTCGIAVNPARK